MRLRRYICQRTIRIQGTVLLIVADGSPASASHFIIIFKSENMLHYLHRSPYLLTFVEIYPALRPRSLTFVEIYPALQDRNILLHFWPFSPKSRRTEKSERLFSESQRLFEKSRYLFPLGSYPSENAYIYTAGASSASSATYFRFSTCARANCTVYPLPTASLDLWSLG